MGNGCRTDHPPDCPPHSRLYGKVWFFWSIPWTLRGFSSATVLTLTRRGQTVSAPLLSFPVASASAIRPFRALTWPLRLALPCPRRHEKASRCCNLSAVYHLREQYALRRDGSEATPTAPVERAAAPASLLECSSPDQLTSYMRI